MYEIECFWSSCWSGNIPALSLFFYQRLTIAIFLTSFFFPNSFWRVDYHIPPLSAPPSLTPLPPPPPPNPHTNVQWHATGSTQSSLLPTAQREGSPKNTSPYPPFLFTPPPVPTAVPHVDMTPWPPLPHIVSICHREGKEGGCLKGHSWQEAAPPWDITHFFTGGEDRMPRAIEPFAKKLSRLYISPGPKNFPSKLWCFGGFFWCCLFCYYHYDNNFTVVYELDSFLRWSSKNIEWQTEWPSPSAG